MAKTAKDAGFWYSAFPNQLGNLCFIVFLFSLTILILYAAFDLNVFDPDDFKSTEARIPDLGTRRVVDDAGVLSQSEIDALTAQIDAYEAASKAQMAVYLIRSLHGDAIEDFSLAVAEKWKIGWRGEDNGVLLLLAMEDRENRLEIGYGLEGVINDARAGDILRLMAPYLRKEQYAKAISFAIASVSALVLHENGPETPGEDAENAEDDESGGEYASSAPKGPEDTLYLVLGFCILFEILGTLLAGGMIYPWVKKSFGLLAMIFIGKLLLEAFLAALKGGGGSGRGGGSSRSGGGGGSFGGGGASGRW